MTPTHPTDSKQVKLASISTPIRHVAEGMEVQAALIDSVKQTWESVRKDIRKFINVATPWVQRIVKEKGIKPGRITEPGLPAAISQGTDKKVILTPELELVPAR